MAALTVQKLVSGGLTPVYAAPTASDTADVGSGSNTWVVYKNTSGASVTVTAKASLAGTTSYGVNLPDIAFVVPATTGEMWIPLRQAYDKGDGTGATLTTSAQAGVTCALVRMT